MNNTSRRLICLLTAFSFAFSLLSIPVSADLYLPPNWKSTIGDAVSDLLNTDYSKATDYINEYRSNHPDSTIYEAYEHFKNSDANGHHGGGGVGGDIDDGGSHHGSAGGYRDSDVIDKLFNYNEVTNYSDKFQGSQSDNEYLSYDGRIRVWCDAGNSGTYDYERKYYITVDGSNPIANNGYLFREVCFNVRYEDTSYHSDGCGWYVKGSILTSTYHYNRNTLKNRYIDLSPYFPVSSAQPYNFYNVYDNSGNRWRYDPVNNYYVDYNDDNHTENYIDLNISQFPEDDFNDFFNQLKNLGRDDSFQFLSLYDMLQQILSSLQNLDTSGGTAIDLSQIKIDIPLNDYTSLLQAIQATLVVMSNNLSTLATHADLLELITLLNNFYIDESNYSSHMPHVCDKLTDVLSRLDVIIELQDIMISQDVLDDITKNEMDTITTYLSLISQLLSMYPLSYVQSSIDAVQSIIFTKEPPPDIHVNIKGVDCVLLSASSIAPFSEALSIARGFVSIVILFAWLIYMRMKIVDTL